MLTVNIRVDDAFQSRVDEADLRATVERTLRAEGVVDGALSLVITDADTVHDLNRAYRGVDAPTDVLSFPMLDAETPSPPGEPPYLGDIVIAFPVAAEQAERYGHSVQEELRLLAVHGTLHLLGYDHATPEEEAVMWQKQEAVLGKSYLGPGGTRKEIGG